jgi:hypothetical protein
VGTAIVPGTVTPPRQTNTVWPPVPSGPPNSQYVYAGETITQRTASAAPRSISQLAQQAAQALALKPLQQKAASLTAARAGVLGGKGVPVAQIGIGVALIGAGVFAGGWWYLLAAGGAVVAVRGGLNLKNLVAPAAPSSTRQERTTAAGNTSAIDPHTTSTTEGG